MMKILICSPPNLVDEFQGRTRPYSIGMMIMYRILSQMQEVSCDLTAIEDMAHARQLLKNQYDLVGVHTISRQRYSVFKIAEMFKKYRASSHILLGGPHVIGLESSIMEHYPFIDFIISGEAETAVEMLALCLLGGDGAAGYARIPNLTWRQGRNEIHAAGTPLEKIRNLDALPFPRYKQEYFTDYLNYSRGAMYFSQPQPIAAVSASRGCYNTCSFCVNKAIFGAQRFHGIDYVLSHLKYLYESHNISRIHFVDDNFCASRARTLEFCRRLTDTGLPMEWRCSSRANDLDEELLQTMAEAGCRMISMGMESGNQKVLDEINKNINVADIIGKFSNIRKSGIALRTSLTIGYENDSLEGCRQTGRLINLIKPEAVVVFVLKVYPGTPLYKKTCDSQSFSDDFWFKNPLDVPFYTLYHTKEDLLKMEQEILGQIKGKIICDNFKSMDDKEIRILW